MTFKNALELYQDFCEKNLRLSHFLSQTCIPKLGQKFRTCEVTPRDVMQPLEEEIAAIIRTAFDMGLVSSWYQFETRKKITFSR